MLQFWGIIMLKGSLFEKCAFFTRQVHCALLPARHQIIFSSFPAPRSSFLLRQNVVFQNHGRNLHRERTAFCRGECISIEDNLSQILEKDQGRNPEQGMHQNYSSPHIASICLLSSGMVKWVPHIILDQEGERWNQTSANNLTWYCYSSKTGCFVNYL